MGFQKTALVALRESLNGFSTNEEWLSHIYKAQIHNQWFEEKQIHLALNNWLDALSDANINQWLGAYELPTEVHNLRLGVIMAGNIPLVGLHDLIIGVLTGYKLVAKMSSDDEVLPKFWLKKASEIDPIWNNQIEYSDNFKNLDAAIATGSNNSARYFEYYFRNIPHILRKNRNSVAVLTGTESEDELIAFGHDVFDFYGLGCRNVTKVYLPAGYAFKTLFDVWEKHHADVAFHNKYVNNYNYHKALLLMNLDPHIDAGYILMKERTQLYSPVGMLNYEFYSNIDDLGVEIDLMKDHIQCVVSVDQRISDLTLGQTQCPKLNDYADGIDTMQWALDSIKI